MPKRAVILGGGGARGPYQIGVWKALRELGIDYHIVTGSSVGALNGALMVQGDYDEAVRLWEQINLRDIAVLSSLPEDVTATEELRRGVREALEQGGLDVTPLEEMVREVVSEERFFASPVDFGLVTVRLPLYTPLQLAKEDIPKGQLVDYLMASASYFPLFQPREIDGKRHIDGAFYDNMPAKLALRCGAEEIIAIDLAGRGLVHRYREKVPVTYIRSRWHLGGIALFDSSTAAEKHTLGYYDGLKAFRRMEGSSYTFYPGESKENTLRLRNAFQAIRQQSGVSLLRHYESVSKQHDDARYHDRRFYKYQGQSYTVGHAVTTAAETAGELLGASPWELYTFSQFNQALLDLARQKKAARELPLTDGASAALAPISRSSGRVILRRIYRMLQHACDAGYASEALWGLVTVSPREFLAAYYLLALTMTEQL